MKAVWGAISVWPGRLAVGAALCTVLSAQAQMPDRRYLVYACAESEDQVALIEYGPQGASLQKTISVGSFPPEIEGPHGINISPDGRFWFVSLAHGNPYGSLHKYRTGSDEWVGDVRLGMYPATLDISGSTGLLFVVNFNLHGGMEASSISVVETDSMIEVERIQTGIMPHGARLNQAGDRLYSVNMMEDELIEVDALSFAVSRRLRLGTPQATHPEGHGEKEHSMAVVQPTWATAPTASGHVYVAGNKSNQIFEVDLDDWSISRSFDETGNGPYNLAITPDQKTLLVTYKKGAAVGIWNLGTAAESARVETIRKIPHGVVVSPDSRFAFVTVEGIGGEPGSVEIISLSNRKRVGVVEIGKQAGGIAFWKMEG